MSESAAPVPDLVAQLEAAIASHQAGDLVTAEQGYRAILSEHPNHPDAWHNLGVLAMQLGQLDAARELLRGVLESHPQQGQFWLSYMQALIVSGELDAARAVLTQGRELGLSGEAVDNLAAQLAASDQAALDSEPEAMPAAQPAHDQENAADALAHGLTALADERYAQAWRALQLASRQHADDAAVWQALGEACYGLGRLDEAERAWRRALALRPDSWAAESALLRVLQHQAASPAEEAARCAQAGAALEARWPTPAAPAVHEHMTLRVGFIGGHLFDHPQAHVLLPLWQALASGSLEVWAYHDSLRADAITERLRAACAGWRDVAALDDDALLAQILADEIDILVDMSGHQAGNRLAVFARQAAPLQISWLSQGESSGLSRMRWRLSDAVSLPPGAPLPGQEPVWRLPESPFCYQPLWHVLQQRPSSDYAVCGAPALHRGYVTFGACQPAACIGPELIALWAQVLHAAPESRLRLELTGLDADDSPLHVTLTTQFAERGIGAHRLQLLAHDPMRRAVRGHDMDIALDSFPVSMGLAACELLWMGVPLVTLPGARAASRSGASVLTALGCPQWIAHSKVDYVRIAKTLASDLPQLNRTRLGLRVEMENSPLRQPQRFAEQLETALQQMWAERG